MDTMLSGDAQTDAQNFPMTARLYAYWEGLKSAPEPCWADVDLMDIYEFVPLVFVADVLPSGNANKFRYRFVGTKIVEMFGLDATGKTVEQAFEGERAALILDVYNSIVTSKSPQLGLRGQANKERGFVHMVVLTVPLFNARGEVDMLMGVNDFSVMNEEDGANFWPPRL
jgi:hypothetical protein